MDYPIIYTIGHSTHHIDYFLELLREYGVNCVIDVRSVAASSYNPQYNQEPLKNFLKNNKIIYLHFAEQFGARQTDPNLLDSEGKLDFEKVRKSWFFQKGLERVWQGIEKGYVMAIMCSESEPLDCHRFSMVSVGLEEDGFAVKHILKDKSLKSNSELEGELISKFEKKLPQKDLFNPQITDEERLKAAYRFKNQEIGFSTHSNPQKEDDYD
ncbi:MAG TPA: hypothetical protein DCL77_21565 [Prolixibacteraceae bacterium]|jgi:uncharacterized protein (DUF488 family)|nr:hypothetical protein [Prolixibacteraceae bacterium]